ncbi:MAG: FCD domain-containing protein [Burkholderiaceae bacterium]
MGESAGRSEVFDRIAGQVLGFIQDHRLGPGDRLPSEREFALRLNVSRPALRESLATLEAMRVIARRPNAGIFVAGDGASPSFESMVLRGGLGLPLDPATVIQSLEVRNLLELQAVDLACERRTDENLAHLDAILASTRARLREGGSIIDLDEAFHLGVVAATGNPVFVQIVQAFYRLSKLRREVYFSDLGRCRRSHRQHTAILRAIAARDRAAAREAMHAHIHEGLLRSLVEQPGAVRGDASAP